MTVSAIRDRGGATSREILDRRLVPGEISVEEYDRAREAMSAQVPTLAPNRARGTGLTHSERSVR